MFYFFFFSGQVDNTTKTIEVIGCPANIQEVEPSEGVFFREITWNEPTAHSTANSGPVIVRHKSHAQPRMFVSVGGNPRLVKYEFEDSAGNTAYCNFTISAVRKFFFLVPPCCSWGCGGSGS